ncbi:type VII secretion protein EccE [Rhodococcus indonesiensis]|uniref:type VII secretion protein EccE n=1 Tax=Rhodococcus indonesiensis TaxID=3055869 RepID=UPI0039F68CB1
MVRAQCAAVAGWTTAVAAGAPPPALVLAAALAAVAVVVPVRGRDAVDWWREWWRFRNRPIRTAPVIVDVAAAGDGPVGVCWDGSAVGVCWDGSAVVAVVELVPAGGDLTRLTRDRADPLRRLPLAAIAACLSRHDVELDGIDVVVHGSRVCDETAAGEAYGSLVGPLPAAATRTVWLALRFDALACPAAVARRGGGSEGAARAVRIAARRVVRALAEQRHAARILDAGEITRAVESVTGGADPLLLEEDRDAVRLPGGLSRAAVVEPGRLDRTTLTHLWSEPLSSATITVRLRPGTEPGTVRMGAVVRGTSRSPEPSRRMPGTRRLWSRELDGLLASTPTAAAGLEDLVPLRTVQLGDVDALTLPVTGCGQVIGADESGAAVSARVTGPGVRSVYVAGELYLAQQLVFRSVAIGARVAIHTDRASAWRPLLAAAGPDRLRLGDDRGVDTIVYDGVVPATVPAGTTAIHVHADPDRWPRERPDVSILQPGAAGDRVVLTTGGRRMSLSLVSVGAEAAFIGRPRAGGRSRAPQPG